jgi:hypothetical protein
LETISHDYDVAVVSLSTVPDNLRYANHFPVRIEGDRAQLKKMVEEFKPNVIHSHWLNNLTVLSELARATNTPYTIRSHSFDTLDGPGSSRTSAWIAQHAGLVDDLCLGILAFPFNRPMLERCGIPQHKIIDCYPVVRYQRFYDRSPNGRAVMSMGACLPKKKFEDFVDLAKMCPERRFNLYALGYRIREIGEYNRQMGGPVTMFAPVEHAEMPHEFKKHEWIVYTADRSMGTVGWSLGVAEAQAAGVGVCFPRLRPDLEEFIGGAGFLFDSLADVQKIISKPYPAEMREKGFEQAKKSDIQGHKKRLTDLWDAAIRKSVGAGYVTSKQDVAGVGQLG